MRKEETIIIEMVLFLARQMERTTEELFRICENFIEWRDATAEEESNNSVFSDSYVESMAESPYPSADAVHDKLVELLIKYYEIDYPMMAKDVPRQFFEVALNTFLQELCQDLGELKNRRNRH